MIDGQWVHPGYAVPGLIALPFEQIARDGLREKIAVNMVAIDALGHLIRHIPLAVLGTSSRLHLCLSAPHDGKGQRRKNAA